MRARKGPSLYPQSANYTNPHKNPVIPEASRRLAYTLGV
jgi:hypothetical protein